MPRQEAGNWKPYNTKFITSNITSVFKNRDIHKLSKAAYQFISLHMGFIAHCNLYGFRDSYQDLEDFAKKLQTSEYSESDHEHNMKWADKREGGSFDDQGGHAYNVSIAETIRGIVAVARKYYPGKGSMAMFYADFTPTTPRSAIKRNSRPRTQKSPGISLGGTR